MITTRILPVLVAAALIGGCETTPTPEAEGPGTQAGVSLETVERVRTRYQSVNPDTRVGYVNASLPGEQLVSVTDVPVEDFREGDAISFITAAQQVIATGRVVNVVDGNVHVKFVADDRAPQVGDLAIKFVR